MFCNNLMGKNNVYMSIYIYKYKTDSHLKINTKLQISYTLIKFKIYVYNIKQEFPSRHRGNKSK